MTDDDDGHTIKVSKEGVLELKQIRSMKATVTVAV